jgi:hypothetical protein
VANVNAPFGFRPTMRYGGAPYSVRMYGKAAGDAQALFLFDIVGRIATGVPLAEATQFDVPTVSSAYAMSTGVSFWVGASLAYGAASTATQHPITDEPDVIYVAQPTDTTVLAWTATSKIGLNAPIDIATNLGSTTTRMSGQGVLSGSAATTPGLDLRIEDVAKISPNLIGEWAVLEVRINRHYNNPGVVATPV